MTIVALTSVFTLTFFWKSYESDTLPEAGLEPPTQVTDSQPAEGRVTIEVAESIVRFAVYDYDASDEDEDAPNTTVRDFKSPTPSQCTKRRAVSTTL